MCYGPDRTICHLCRIADSHCLDWGNRGIGVWTMDAIDTLHQAAFEATLDAAHAENSTLRLENADLKRQIASLRQMVPLLKGRLDAFLVWFQGTVDGIH